MSSGAVAGVETDTNEQVPLAAVVSNLSDAVRTHRELAGRHQGGPAF